MKDLCSRRSTSFRTLGIRCAFRGESIFRIQKFSSNGMSILLFIHLFNRKVLYEKRLRNDCRREIL